jgi:hypothetical protein
VVGIGERAAADDELHLALLAERTEPAGELADDLVLPVAQLIDVDLRPVERDTDGTGLFGFVDDLGGMEEGLAGDAPLEEADAAGVGLEVDEGDIEAVVSRHEGCGIPAGATPENDDTLVVCVRHGNLVKSLSR